MMQRVYRHPIVVRITHWVVALAILILTMSGLQIFMAHPALYASDASKFDAPVFSIYSEMDNAGNPVGKLQIGSKVITTTGLLGWTSDGMGGEASRAFPAWATIPAYRALADGRRWHIFFAWVLGLCAILYAVWAFKLVPTKTEIRELPEALKEHALPWKVKATAHYNPLQKIAYFGVVFMLVPLAIVSGLALSPSFDAWAPWVPALLGGRQFARLWHFVAMWGIIGFFIGHFMMVALTGFWNNLRAMITGWFAVEESP
ncbi:MAG TPA: cytochrome b/b6 domain-containing protein [Candidatus Eremiobacteraceae bacterium]|nr:cytochrome b/b6 domain-containing protein [Candidatus Eremiobacteraceae bacterium]